MLVSLFSSSEVFKLQHLLVAIMMVLMMRVTGVETVQVTPLRRTLASSQRAVKRLWCVCGVVLMAGVVCRFMLELTMEQCSEYVKKIVTLAESAGCQVISLHSS